MWRPRVLAGLGLALVVLGGGTWAAVRSMPTASIDAELAQADTVSATVLDRHGRLLRAFTTPDGRWRLPIEPREVDPRYLAMLVAFEDRRFHRHPGVDPLALLRAGLQLARHARIVSGGSTLTMQAARLLDGQHERSSAGKLRQIVRALQLEARLGKERILRLYLRLAPFGGNIEGVRAAALTYFGKEPGRLSVAEAALLVALPQSPELRRPDRFPDAARRARDRVIARAALAGVISAAEAAEARREPLPAARREFPKLAPHLAEAEATHTPNSPVTRLTIDRDLQTPLERAARDHARALGSHLSAALLVVEHRTGEVLAYVGSSDYFDGSRLGAVDMTRAVRSPGSTLKPLIYGLAFEAGLAHPETLIEDRPARFGTYAPKNFDQDFRGTVTVREALAQSLNIPAVAMLAAVGPGKLLGRMRLAGVAPVLPLHAEPTLAVALGGIGLKLQDLAQLYATIARGGQPTPLVWRRNGRAPLGLRGRALFSSVAAWYVADILKDAAPPAHAKAGQIAYKTGTSYGFRDAWAVGFDGRHTVAVWVGRADGSATAGLTGRSAAAPLLFDAFARMGKERTPLPPQPPGVLKVAGTALPPPLRRFRGAGEEPSTGAFLEPPVQIAFPPDRAIVEAPEGSILLKAEGGVLPLTWLVDGAPLVSEAHRREADWLPAGRGFARVTVIDARGVTDRVVVRLR